MEMLRSTKWSFRVGKIKLPSRTVNLKFYPTTTV